MESILSAGDDQIIPELSPEVYQNQASYIVSRSQTRTTCPTPVLSSNGVRTAKISIVDGNFLDLSTCWFSFIVRNTSTDAHPLQPTDAIPSNWFRRCIVKVNGAVVDDVLHMNRVEQQIERFVSTNKKRNWGDAGHGWETLDDTGIGVSKKIKNGQARRVTWRPLSLGFLQAQKLLPCLGGAASGLTFEFELEDATKACLDAANHSTKWQLESFSCHIDSVQCTSEFTASMADMLIRGESILIPYSTNVCDVQFLQVGGSYTLSLAKQYSRLATVFVSLGVADDNTSVHTKEANNFFLSRNAKVPGAGELATYIQIGNQRWPVFDQEGTKEAFHRLIQATGTWNSTAHAICIGADAYEGVNAEDLKADGTAATAADATHWIAGYDLESLPQAQSTGHSRPRWSADPSQFEERGKRHKGLHHLPRGRRARDQEPGRYRIQLSKTALKIKCGYSFSKLYLARHSTLTF
jgi:hypothetical protein